MNYGIDICLRELLFEQECVIIPNFGGFISQYKSAEINHLAKLIFPPTKSISFNRQLKNDDGLLTNTYAVLNNVSYSEAALAVKKWVANFERELQEKGEAKIGKIGTFFYNKIDNTISFDFEIGQNYLPETYGLSYVKVSPIQRNVAIATKKETIAEEPKLIDVIAEREKRETIEEAILAEPFLKTDDLENTANETNSVEENPEKNGKKRGNSVVAFLAGVAFALTLTLPVFNIHAPNLNLNEANVFSVFNKLFQLKNTLNVEPIAFSENAIPPVSSDIKVSTPVFVDSETFDLKSNTATVLTNEQKFEVVLGTFSKKSNAEKLVSEIKEKHANLNVIHYQNNGKNYVVIPAGNNEVNAEKLLQETRSNYDCWLKKN